MSNKIILASKSKVRKNILDNYFQSMLWIKFLNIIEHAPKINYSSFAYTVFMH